MVVYERGKISFPLSLPIKTVYAGSFKNKEGKEILYYRAIVPTNSGIEQIAITETLYNELQDGGARDFTVTATLDLNYGSKLKLDTLQ